MQAVVDAFEWLWNPPERLEVAHARQSADRVIRAAQELGAHDVLAALVRNVKGDRPARRKPSKSFKAFNG